MVDTPMVDRRFVDPTVADGTLTDGRVVDRRVLNDGIDSVFDGTAVDGMTLVGRLVDSRVVDTRVVNDGTDGTAVDGRIFSGEADGAVVDVVEATLALLSCSGILGVVAENSCTCSYFSGTGSTDINGLTEMIVMGLLVTPLGSVGMDGVLLKTFTTEIGFSTGASFALPPLVVWAPLSLLLAVMSKAEPPLTLLPPAGWLITKTSLSRLTS